MECILLRFFKLNSKCHQKSRHNDSNNDKEDQQYDSIVDIEILNEICMNLHEKIKSPTDPIIDSFRSMAIQAAYQCFLQSDYKNVIKYLDWIFIVTGEKFSNIIELLENELSLTNPFAFQNDSLLESFLSSFLSCSSSLSFPLSSSVLSDVLSSDQLKSFPAFTKSYSHLLPKWNPYTILKVGAHRLVSVEIGNNYLESSWYQELMTIEDYFKRFVIRKTVIKDENEKEKNDNVTNNPSVIGYIAQYDLASQIPSLSRDLHEFEEIAILGRRQGEMEKIEKKNYFNNHSNFPFSIPSSHFVLFRNCWIGIQGTTTPFHRDQYENIFVQIYGYKQICLIDKQYELPMADDNTSNLDPDSTNINIPMKKFIIGPGEILNIEKGEWHHVKALSFSISISYWWREK